MSKKSPSPQAAADQHAALGLDTAKKSTHTTHPEAQWFPGAGLGLFVHWGIASVHGQLDLSWAMIANSPYDAEAQGRNKLKPDDYWALAEKFQPDRYDPDKWVSAASRAGCQYAVLTAMHHDGYTMWPTAHGELGVQSHMRGRDLVGPFVEACRRHGLKVGLYYSPPDWFMDRRHMSFHYGSDRPERFPGRPHFNPRHEPCEILGRTPEHLARHRAAWLARVEELLTRYGRIDLLWFDGGGHDNGIRDRALELQPHLVINSRSCDGDFDSTECCLPQERFEGWLETPHCWQASDIKAPWGSMVDFWGYLKAEKYKPTGWMLEQLARLRTWGGNLLINVGPRPNGEMPDVVYERLDETAGWMAHSRESVIGAMPGPFPEQCDVPLTISPCGKKWYLLFPPGSGNAATVSRGQKPASARLLRTGESLPVAMERDGVFKISIPADRRTELVDAVAIE